MMEIVEEPEHPAESQPFITQKIVGGEMSQADERLAILLVQSSESLSDLSKRMDEPLALVQSGGSLLIVFPKSWDKSTSVRSRQEFLTILQSYAARIAVAAHERVVLLSAFDRGCTILDSREELKSFLGNHPYGSKALRHYSAGKWQEEMIHFLLKLRAISVHRMSVATFLCFSIALFGTVLFIAIPSARIRIWPAVNLVSHTANVVLIASGSILESDPKYVLPLLTIHTTVRQSFQFTEISKKFLGENAVTAMTMINESDQPYFLRAGTRLVNQAGMIFKIEDAIEIPAATVVEPGVTQVKAVAAPEDLYGQIIGDRGNIPAGIKWEIPGLPLEERAFVYARNNEGATGGITRYGQELQEKDLELAEKQLRQELIARAKERTGEEISLRSAMENHTYVVLQYDVLTGMSFSGFTMPTDLIGQEVPSIPVEGSLAYTILAYSKDELLKLLLPRLIDHVEEGRELIEESAVMDGISVHVIEYDDALQWVKITAELTGKQRSILSPISSSGRVFVERVREMIRGKSVGDAVRIIQNFPEVDRVEISVWPPWRSSIPSLEDNIAIIPQDL